MEGDPPSGEESRRVPRKIDGSRGSRCGDPSAGNGSQPRDVASRLGALENYRMKLSFTARCVKRLPEAVAATSRAENVQHAELRMGMCSSTCSISRLCIADAGDPWRLR